jgi:two-component system, NtrC family, sensor kinase
MQPRLEHILLRVSQSPAIDAGAQDGAIRLVLDSVCEGLGVARCGVWFYDAAREAIVCELLIDTPNHDELRDTRLSAAQFPRYFEALATERVIAADDAGADPRTAEFTDSYLGPLGIGAMLDAPIRHHGRMIGIICAEHIGPPRPWTADEATFAGSLADLVGRAINARAHRQLCDRLEARVAERTTTLQTTVEQLREAQAHLIAVEKHAALGRVVAGIAHELETPLGNAVMTASAVHDGLRPLLAQLEAGQLRKSALAEGLGQAREASALLLSNLHRASELIRQFKGVAVDQASERRRGFDAAQVLREVLATLGPRLRRHPHTLVLELQDGLRCDSYPGPLGQVLGNLVMNALLHGLDDACPGRLLVNLREAGPGQCLLTVADDGRGMSPEVRARLFDPFFTTRLGQGGSGLGLNIVQALVIRVLGGSLAVDSEPGVGSRFEILFPCTAP